MAARNRYKKIFDMMSLAVLIVEDCKIIDANKEAAHLLRENREQLINSTLLELLGLYETDLKAKGEMEISLNDGYNKKHLSVHTLPLEESEVEMKNHPTYLLTLKSVGHRN
jgi:transcriptional regulator with PAS, ATPase and Fis domain